MVCWGDGAVCCVGVSGVRWLAEGGGAGRGGGAFSSPEVSPNGTRLALFSEAKGYVDVYACARGTCGDLFARLDVGAAAAAAASAAAGGFAPGKGRFAWCGNSAVAIGERHRAPPRPMHVLVAGLDGSHAAFPVPRAVHLVAERDGVRLVGKHFSGMIEVVPDAERVALGAPDSPAGILAGLAGVVVGSPRGGAYDDAVAGGGRQHDGLGAEVGEEDRLYVHSVAEGAALARIEGVSDLSAAVETCLEAALGSHAVSQQMLLLRAAMVGRGELFTRASKRGGKARREDGADASQHTKDALFRAAATLRVLNNARRPELAGMALTHRQLRELGLEGLVWRLVRLGHADLALKVWALCDAVEPAGHTSDGWDRVQAAVLGEWAEAHVVARGGRDSDAGLLSDVARRCSGYVGAAAGRRARLFPLGRVCHAASRVGRGGLALGLAGLEASLERRVGLLAGLPGGETEALEVAGTDALLLDAAMGILRRRLPFHQFAMAVGGSGAAKRLFAAQCKVLGDAGVLREFLTLSGDPGGRGELQFREAIGHKLMGDEDKCVAGLSEAVKSLTIGAAQAAKGDHKGADRGTGVAFLGSMAGELKALLAAQKAAEERVAPLRARKSKAALTDPMLRPLEGLSLYDTLARLLALSARSGNDGVDSWLELADKLRKDFRVPDRRWWQLEAQAWADGGCMARMEALVTEFRRGPAGREDADAAPAFLAGACLRAGRHDMAALWGRKVKDVERRADLLCRSRCWDEALDSARQIKDSASQDLVSSRIASLRPQTPM